MMTNRHRSALYTGMTNHLERRVYQHKTKALPGYTSRYGVDCLVYFEETSDVLAAIAREKEIKGWTRARKIAIIESLNPEWRDLSETWSDPPSAFDWGGRSQVTPDVWVPAAPPPDSFAEGHRSAAGRGRRSE